MTVRDLYVNTDENQEFIMRFESEPSKAYYKGKLEYCPSELMHMLVYKFRAIDFNTIEVILIGNMNSILIDYYKELSHTINNYIKLIRHDIAINDYSSASICYDKAAKIIDFYFNDGKLSNDAYMYFIRRLMFHVKH